MESLFAISHNHLVSQTQELYLRKFKASYQSALAKVHEQNAQALISLEADLQKDLEDDRKRSRRVVDAIAAGLRAFGRAGRSMQQAADSNSSNYSPRNRSSAPGGYDSGSCTSDYSCGVGRKCIKSNYSTSGFCATTVDNYGMRKFNMPELDSFGVKRPEVTDCKYDSDCPVGFRCNQKSGACLM